MFVTGSNLDDAISDGGATAALARSVPDYSKVGQAAGVASGGESLAQVDDCMGSRIAQLRDVISA